jgi:hypothetical protein
MKENHAYESDDLNPEYLFNTVHTELLLKLATGAVNAQKLACKNMASRGLGRNGEWIGFDQAKKEWNLSLGRR